MFTTEDCTVGLLVEVTVAWLATVPQVAVVVVEVMCTDNEEPGARETPLAPPQVSTPVLIAQVPSHPADGGLVVVSMLQFNPALVGKVSLSLTPVAVPV